MDTLAYLHLAATHEAPIEDRKAVTNLCCRFLFEQLNRAKHLKFNSISLSFFIIALATVAIANPAYALRKGNRGSQVTSLQNNLRAAGHYSGPVTGYYGSLTTAAIVRFQQAKGLIPDGVAGPNTLSALASELEPPDSSQITSLPSVITEDSSTEIGEDSSDVITEDTSTEIGEDSSDVVTEDTSTEIGEDSSDVITEDTSTEIGEGSSDVITEDSSTEIGEDSSDVVTEDSSTEITENSSTQASENSSSPSFPSNVVLRRGQRSSVITSLQRSLQTAGHFNGPVTGYYGSLTQAAVVSFQRARGLSPDGVAGPNTLAALESGSATTTPSEFTTPNSVFNNESFIGEASQEEDSQGTVAAGSPSWMKLKTTITGKISPKSIVYSGTGLFFAQNMMYSHTITVYDREYTLVKTIPDVVDLSKFGYSKYEGKHKGAPVEAGFSHGGKYAWVSNYQMYGSGFNKPGSDKCSPEQKTDESFLYRINTESLEVEEVIQVGSVPKFLAASPDNRLVLVTNWCTWDLSVVDTEKNLELKRIKLGRYPRGVAIDSASQKAYVAVMGSYDIAVVDLNDYSVDWLKNVGRSPRHLSIDPSNRYLYATLNGEGKVAKIDLSTGQVLNKVVTGNAPRSMVISDDGQVLYVVNYNSNTVSKVRTSDMKVLQTVSTNANPIGITYDPVSREVWVACYSGSIMVFQD
ncbi:MAG: peptidoglycan-binding protein [Coleofasciculaceae cyanobacterium]